MEFDQIKKLLTDENYQTALARYAEQTNTAVYPGIDIPVLSIAWEEIRKSGLKEPDFYHILHTYPGEIVAYCVKGSEMFSEDEELQQEYAGGEEPGEDGQDEIVETRGLSVLAVLSGMIEFHYLTKNDDKGLAAFFKKYGVPYAAKYLTQCKEAFLAAMPSENDT
jgi:hypothetical protein